MILYCAAVLSAGQNEGYFAEASLILQAFGYLIEWKSHFYVADTYSPPVLYPNAVVLKTMIPTDLNECELWSSYEQIWNKLT